jgi:hypothetical protein
VGLGNLTSKGKGLETTQKCSTWGKEVWWKPKEGEALGRYWEAHPPFSYGPSLQGQGEVILSSRGLTMGIDGRELRIIATNPTAET